MRKLIMITSLMLALASPCTGQSANVQSGQVGVAAEKDLVRELYQMYQSGQVDLGNNYFLMASFRILRDGSIRKESIHIIHSSGSRLIDKKTFELLRRLGESHALRPLFSLFSNTIELLVSDTVMKLAMTSFPQTAEEAQAKVTQLRFLLKSLAARGGKNPMFSELLSHLVVKADNRRIDIEVTLGSAPLQRNVAGGSLSLASGSA